MKKMKKVCSAFIIIGAIYCVHSWPERTLLAWYQWALNPRSAMFHTDDRKNFPQTSLWLCTSQAFFFLLCPYASMASGVGHVYSMIPPLALHHCAAMLWISTVGSGSILGAHPTPSQLTVTSLHKEVTANPQIFLNLSASPVQLPLSYILAPRQSDILDTRERMTESMSEEKETAVLASLMVTFMQIHDDMGAHG